MSPVRKPQPNAQPPIAGVTVVRRDVDDPARWRELARLLNELLDKPVTPGEGRRP